MSDGISISEGGYTAVSSESLRDAAHRAVAVASLLREAVTSATRAGDNLDCMTVRLRVADDVTRAAALAATLAQLIDVFAAQLVRAADIYEAAELLIESNMNGVTPAIEQRLGEMEERRPGIVREALAVALLAGGMKSYASMSALPRTGKDVYIVDRKTSHTTNAAAVAPKGAADLARAIPTGDAQIRVDRYNMADGTQRFVVSVSGTKAFSSTGEPFDMNSNAALYTGHDSTSAEAVRRALEDVGVEPGDWLLMNTHSQAAMIADRLAPDPSVDPEMVVTWGNPGEQPMPSDVVNIDIKHTNDPVGWLGGGEYPVPTGDDASFEVSRDTNAGRPGSVISDTATAHFMEAYVETGSMMDGSADPRMDALRDPLAELADAESVTTTEYQMWEHPLPPDGTETRHYRGFDGVPDAASERMHAGGLAGEFAGDGGPGAADRFGSLDGQSPNNPLFEFSDPVTPDQFGIAPPPEPGPPTFEFGEQPIPQPSDDNHVGPWRV